MAGPRPSISAGMPDFHTAHLWRLLALMFRNLEAGDDGVGVMCEADAVKAVG